MFDKHLFFEDLKGSNGSVSQELALQEINKIFDWFESFDNVEATLKENESLFERNEELLDEVHGLKKEIKKLKSENKTLELENIEVGNILDYIVVEQGFSLPISK